MHDFIPDLVQREALLRQVLEQSPISLLITDVEGKILHVNPFLVKISGYTKKELVGQDFSVLVSREGSDFSYQELLDAVKNGKEWRGELLSKDKNKNNFWEEVFVSPVFDSSGVIIYYVTRKMDITERKVSEKALQESELRLRELSTKDDLTGLFNQRYFWEKLHDEIRRSNRYKQSLSLLLFDIDNFKKINDTYGHAEGDMVLEKIGLITQSCLRDIDSAYRYGGEEFTVLLPVTTKETAVRVAQRIASKLRGVLFTTKLGESFKVTLSIGVTQYVAGMVAEELVRVADVIMYEAKNSGKDKICT